MATTSTRRTANGEIRYDVRARIGARVVTKTFKRKVDAVRYERLLEADRVRGVALDPRGGRIALDDWWALWWPSTVNLRVSTRTRDEVMYGARIKPTLGDVTLEQLDRPTLRVWVAELQAAGLAPSTVHKVVQILSKTLRAAVDDGRLARNPAERLDLPRVERDEMRFLSPTDVATLSEEIEDRWRALVILAAYGGLRLGELFALRRHRVDLMRQTVDVAETIGHPGGQLFVGPPKTRAGRRLVPVPRVVVEALEVHFAAMGEIGHDGLVFPNDHGGYARGEHFRVAMCIPRSSGPGSRRCASTTCDTRPCPSGSPRARHRTRSPARAGHTSVVTVLDRYGHLLPGSEDRVNDALDALADGAVAAPDATVIELPAR